MIPGAAKAKFLATARNNASKFAILSYQVAFKFQVDGLLRSTHPCMFETWYKVLTASGAPRPGGSQRVRS
jgi:hypothetical protein